MVGISCCIREVGSDGERMPVLESFMHMVLGELGEYMYQ